MISTLAAGDDSDDLKPVTGLELLSLEFRGGNSRAVEFNNHAARQQIL
jgi:hypothetical protein